MATPGVSINYFLEKTRTHTGTPTPKLEPNVICGVIRVRMYDRWHLEIMCNASDMRQRFANCFNMTITRTINMYGTTDSSYCIHQTSYTFARACKVVKNVLEKVGY